MSEQLGWYWRRVRAMSPREVAERSRRSLVNVADAASFHVGRPVWRARWEPDIDRLLVRDPLSAPVGMLTPERAAGLRARFPSEADRLLDRAAAVLERRVRFFGYPEVVLASEPDDNDPFTGRRWPNLHAKRIDYRRDDVGDPKWIWELNRCQSLPLLVAAWLVSGDRQYAQAASDRLESWVDAHPPGRGIAWSSGFEAGIRAISLATAVDALRGSEFLDADPLAKALVSLWQHARWIERDPSIGSSANNHRIGELVGLLVIGAMAPELRPASQWLDEALESLDQQVERQILADGTSSNRRSHTMFSYSISSSLPWRRWTARAVPCPPR
jgi:Heparinase II/III N-terminus